MARKLTTINWNQVEKMLRYTCDVSDIAAQLGIPPSTLHRACKREKNQTFSEYADRFFEAYYLLIREADNQASAQLLTIDDQLINCLAQYSIDLNIPFEIEQIYDCINLYLDLIEESNRPKAQTILGHLMLTALRNHKDSYWEWICMELVFEEFTYMTGDDHKRSALAELNNYGELDEIDDAILDQYNERIERYAKNPHIYR